QPLAQHDAQRAAQITSGRRVMTGRTLPDAALGLSAPGTTTVGLANRRLTRPIAMSELQPGDLVIDATGNNNTRHVVIFEKWNDTAHRSYTGCDRDRRQRGNGTILEP
ncbi:hypothetical protein ACFYQB_36915, partial [Streptomyces hirsutus]